MRSLGADGMPVTFSVRLERDTVKPEAFRVTTADGKVVTPKCATLRPADERLENRTVLLAGTFGALEAQPTAVEIVGDLRYAPSGTKQVVQLTWEGGVTGPSGSDLEEPQRTAVTLTLADGSTVMPTALADDDPDNFVHACLADAVEALSVAVKAGYFHDPRDDANPATTIEVISGQP